MKTKDLKEIAKYSKVAADLLKALAHETRLMAVCFIGNGEKNVKDLEEYLGTTQANVSQHLAKLRLAGILETRKEANQVYYSVKNEKVLLIIDALCVTCSFKS